MFLVPRLFLAAVVTDRYSICDCKNNEFDSMHGCKAAARHIVPPAAWLARDLNFRFRLCHENDIRASE
jgi:hypothetical protein